MRHGLHHICHDKLLQVLILYGYTVLFVVACPWVRRISSEMVTEDDRRWRESMLQTCKCLPAEDLSDSAHYHDQSCPGA